jgi:hypothetical protein
MHRQGRLYKLESYLDDSNQGKLEERASKRDFQLSQKTSNCCTIASLGLKFSTNQKTIESLQLVNLRSKDLCSDYSETLDTRVFELRYKSNLTLCLHQAFTMTNKIEFQLAGSQLKASKISKRARFINLKQIVL